MIDDKIRREWDDTGWDYRRSISSGTSSSAWLRDILLKPAIVRLLGDRSKARVLDVGTGGGWLFDEVPVAEAHACDISPPEKIDPRVDFRVADVLDLPYQNEIFDAVVASIVLCYVDDLPKAAAELARVTKSGGAAVVALVHPYFYRTGHVEADDSYRITEDLAEQRSFPIRIGEQSGPFTYYFHPFPHYLNAFVSTGWFVDHVEDAFIPINRYLLQFPNGVDPVRRTSRVPIFTFMAFRRE